MTADEWQETATLFAQSGDSERAAAALRRAERARSSSEPPHRAVHSPTTLDAFGAEEPSAAAVPTPAFATDRPAGGASNGGAVVAGLPVKVLAGATFAAVVFLLFFHVVTGGMSGVRIVPKVTPSFSETFVSIDAITGMPFIAARTRYPLAVQALQRAGLLETNEAFEARIQAEAEAEMEAVQREIDAEIAAAQRQYEAEMAAAQRQVEAEIAAEIEAARRQAEQEMANWQRQFGY
ncbi:MAG TPA: hypothetical protein DCZ72_04960 [Armatimonadetes bacterium]|nr:hypothetical protein [Armatimonadota bacterium]